MSNNQKILYVITKSNWGGAQRYVYDLAVAAKSYKLKANSSEAIVALGGDGALKDKLEAAGVRVVPVLALERDVGITKDVRAFFALLALYRREQPDVIHLNSSKAAGIGVLAARAYRFVVLVTSYQLPVPKIIVTLHGLPHLEPRPFWQRQLIKIFTWFTMLLAHQTITVSEHDRRIVEKWPGLRRKVVTIWNGIETTEYMPTTEARKEILTRAAISNFPAFTEAPAGKQFPISNKISNVKFQTPVPDLWIGTIAELHPNKGLDTLIEALALLKAKSYQLKAFLIGSGELRGSLASLIAERDLGEHVVLTGHIENAAELLPAFDLFVLPSRKEGLPYVLIEALHAGVPIIATRVGGIPEIVIHEETGLLVAPNDSTALAEAIERLASDIELRARLGTSARESARMFSLERMITRTYAVYEN
ncbi:MAG: glycosyltransferase family 4 protein [bacterium]|nr:glycosyltransferase family 4 protein [bacterium]MDZ4284533.1 glycosyltransferase family 4 protein [Patescibacteria group bacterium]